MDEDWRRRCEWCGNLIPEHAHARKTFCSTRCKNAYFNGLIAEARAEARAALICQCCGGPMPAKRQDRKYCCLGCQWRAASRRRRIMLSDNP
jgi:endogenous inhibitor of DNA gyrase (YacG/DUF329 family)